MPESRSVSVEDTVIGYDLVRSPRARRMRIVVKPGRVEVVAPRLADAEAIETFVNSKKRWIHQKTESLRRRTLLAVPERFESGARVLFRGRWLRLSVATGARAVRYANGFRVTVPHGLSANEEERQARELLLSWLRSRVLADAEGWAKGYGARLGVFPTRIRVGNQKTLWGSCSARGVVALNWRLIAAPRRIFEYVVVHELCHLLERNHGPRFWRLVDGLLPDFRERRAWLKRHGVALA